MKQTKWSNKEINYLKKNAEKITVKEMSIALDRSEKAIREKLRRIGCSLTLIKGVDKFPWTEEEDKFLIDNYIKLTVKEMSKVLDRSCSGIAARKYKLGLNQKHKTINGNGKVYKFKDSDAYDLFYEKETNTLRVYHRVIYENHYKVKLKKTEKIHHIDGNKKNNDISNLLKCSSTKRHREVHAQLEKVAYQLIKEGYILFDKDKEEYIANSNRRLIKD